MISSNFFIEVGGGDQLHDGKEIPISVQPSPKSTSTTNGSSHSHPIEIPIHPANHELATDQVLEQMHQVSPPSTTNGFTSGKSPKNGGGGGPKVFRVGSNEGKCLRPQGW